MEDGIAQLCLYVLLTMYMCICICVSVQQKA